MAFTGEFTPETTLQYRVLPALLRSRAVLNALSAVTEEAGSDRVTAAPIHPDLQDRTQSRSTIRETLQEDR